MARITIIPSDLAVYIGGTAREFESSTFSAFGVPSNVHALQWYDTKGWIEFTDDGDPFTPKEPNLIIEELPTWANACVTAYETWTPPAPEPDVDSTPTVVVP